jgi:hypothetical protein
MDIIISLAGFMAFPLMGLSLYLGFINYSVYSIFVLALVGTILYFLVKSNVLSKLFYRGNPIKIVMMIYFTQLLFPAGVLFGIGWLMSWIIS